MDRPLLLEMINTFYCFVSMADSNHWMEVNPVLILFSPRVITAAEYEELSTELDTNNSQDRHAIRR